MIPAAIVRDVLVPLAVTLVEPLPVGMSGALVYRCCLPSGEQRVLRRWPVGTDADRVAEVTRVMQHARAGGCEWIPHLFPVGEGGVLIRSVDDCCWQLLEFMPGEPLPVDTDLESIRRGADAIARFHASTVDLGVIRQPAAAIGSRLKRSAQLRPWIDQIMAMGPQGVIAATGHELAAAAGEARQLLIWHWDAVAAQIQHDLAGYLHEPLHTQFVLRDIHRENAFFVDGQPSGLIDCDAVRVDSPWTDLARWVGGFLGGPHPSEQVWEAAMLGFCRNHPLCAGPEIEFGLTLAKRICFATTWISLANWLVWLIVEGREFEAPAKVIASRIDGLRRLAALDL